MSKFIKNLFRRRGAQGKFGLSDNDHHNNTVKPCASGSQYITLDLLAHAERIAPDAASPIYRINAITAVKTGDGVRMTEAASMRFVRDNTSVPVPEVLEAFVHDESKQVCIVMEYIDGRPLNETWDSYTGSQKEHVVAQLKQYMHELRQISQTSIGSIDGTCCEDQFFSEDPTSYGPFDSESAFNDGLIRALRARGQNTWTELVVRFIRALPSHRIVFTHKDLAPRNILVRDGNVVAIVDWEFSGFYPEYWEYVKALYWPDWQSGWVKDNVLDRTLQAWLLELSYLLHARDIIW